MGKRNINDNRICHTSNINWITYMKEIWNEVLKTIGGWTLLGLSTAGLLYYLGLYAVQCNHTVCVLIPK